jgi:hypothetical protein
MAASSEFVAELDFTVPVAIVEKTHQALLGIAAAARSRQGAVARTHVAAGSHGALPDAQQLSRAGRGPPPKHGRPRSLPPHVDAPQFGVRGTSRQCRWRAAHTPANSTPPLQPRAYQVRTGLGARMRARTARSVDAARVCRRLWLGAARALHHFPQCLLAFATRRRSALATRTALQCTECPCWQCMVRGTAACCCGALCGTRPAHTWCHAMQTMRCCRPRAPTATLLARALPLAFCANRRMPGALQAPARTCMPGALRAPARAAALSCSAHASRSCHRWPGGITTSGASFRL